MTLKTAWLLWLNELIGDDKQARQTIGRLMTEPGFKDPEPHIRELTLKHIKPALAAMLAEYDTRLQRARQQKIADEEPPTPKRSRHKAKPKAKADDGPKALTLPEGGYIQ